jgi:hypothetical protein
MQAITHRSLHIFEIVYDWNFRIVWISSSNACNLSSSILTRLCGTDQHERTYHKYGIIDTPGNNTFGFLCICRTEVGNLSSFKLCQSGLPPQCPSRTNIEMCQELVGNTTHSRTALAESVVLNFVNVFTYSSVLL